MFRTILMITSAAALGAVGASVVASIAGMPGDDVIHLLWLFLPAAAATALASVGLARLMRGARLRARLVALSVFSIAIAIANVAVLAKLMFVSAHDSLLVIALLLFAAGAGIGVALALTRSTTETLEQVAESARAFRDGKLDTRAGRVAGDPELTEIARALDDMADGLERSIARERELEARRLDLISAVSHDLRTPLASLRAMIEAIDDGIVQDPATLRRYVGEMKGSMESLIELVGDLFELVKLDAAAIESETERARFKDVVTSAMAVCVPEAGAKELRLGSRIDGVENVACSPRMVRVLQNLLTNAIRHTPADGSVMIDASLEAGGLAVMISDTGEGIATGDLDRVFEPFWRGDKARSTSGSGLGLALAKRIVESLHGTIEVQSEMGSGSRFSVWVPVHGNRAQEARAST